VFTVAQQGLETATFSNVYVNGGTLNIPSTLNIDAARWITRRSASAATRTLGRDGCISVRRPR
jgi:hypothetical protein